MENIIVILAFCNHWFFFSFLFIPPLFQIIQLWALKNNVRGRAEHLQIESDLLHRTITGDDKQIFMYDLETKHKSKSLISLRPKKARQSKLKSKSCLLWGGIIHSEFLSLGQTINHQVYKKILQSILCSVHEKRWESWQDKLAASPQQCTCSQNPENRVVSGWEGHHHDGTTSLFTWSLCDFFLFPFQGDHQGVPFWRGESHQKGCNNNAEKHPWRILLAVHRNMEKKNGKRYWTQRILCWRQNHIVSCLALK